MMNSPESGVKNASPTVLTSRKRPALAFLSPRPWGFFSYQATRANSPTLSALVMPWR